MVRTLHRHPDMTAPELGDLMGLTADSVRMARKRYGRWTAHSDAICVLCDQRPVWRESARARGMRLCKACYLAEMRKRSEEDRESARVRQYDRRTRGGAGREGPWRG